MSYVMNLKVLSHLSCNHLFWVCLNTHEFHNLDINTRVILNMFFTFVVVVMEKVEV